MEYLQKEGWGRTRDEIEGKTIEEKLDDINKLNTLDQIYRNIKLHYLKEEWKRTFEEMEDDDVEWKMDVENVMRSIKMKFLKEDFKRIQSFAVKK